MAIDLCEKFFPQKTYYTVLASWLWQYFDVCLKHFMNTKRLLLIIIIGMAFIVCIPLLSSIVTNAFPYYFLVVFPLLHCYCAIKQALQLHNYNYVYVLSY